ncbi:MAG: hypothetical protein DMF68_17195 [Acidobacteria bacterium]|nr:MAG: hypothetical protein DMF68_17195 [Acidobacteriota bacterium]
MKKSSLAVLLLLLCLSFHQSLACTTFCLKSNGEVLFGRNYDWTIGDALVFVNKRGVAKTATVAEDGNPAKWVSKYGSVTFNQYGRENPTGGMNEAGLVVEVMWLNETEYSTDNSLPAVGSQEWVEYQLDTAATVDEAINNAGRLRINSDVKIHYLISDRMGRAATVEFLNGKLVVHSGAQLIVPTLTNDTYEKSLSYAKQINLEKATSEGSLDRFTRAAHRTKEFEKNPVSGREAVAYAFEILSDAAAKGTNEGTQWSIVYDQKRGQIYFRTLQSPQIKMIDMKAFDYSCGSAVKIFDMNSKESGDVTAKFADYTRKANRDLIEHSFSRTDLLKDLPAMVRDFVASYPETFSCSQVDKKSSHP